jgi:hypothetical protein
MSEQKIYQGNPNLLKSGSEYEYEPWQIQEIIKCREDPIYFIKNYIYIINLDDGKVKFNLYPFQERLIDTIHNNKRILGKIGRQSGKTATVSAWLCHFTIFNANKTSAILANKEATAREILSRIKMMIENLPDFLKIGIEEWNKSSIVCENGSRILASSTSSSAIRGYSIANLFLDEFAFISPGIFEDFFQSVYPTVSSSNTARIIMISTPYGMNHFYKFWVDAEKGRSSFIPFEASYDEVPGRDEEWLQQQIDDIGIQRVSQEYLCDFLGSSNTLIDGKKLKNLVYQDPVQTQMKESFRIYEKPDKEKQYVLICDVAEGVGGNGDYSTIQIIDVSEIPYNQVATYEDNTIKPNVFSTVINTIGLTYNNALVIVENNTIGMEVLNNLNYNEEYPEILFHNKKFGLRMTKGSKNIGCSHLKNFIESDKLIINDFNTIQQFTYFERKKNGTYSAEDRKHDDLITPLIHFCFFMTQENLVDMWLDQENVMNKLYSKTYEEIEEDLLPIGFLPDNYYDDF